jgi:bifunctional DNA-binding transcriptional regulator/antitoxin component of YhaV-PrlF toxin-antitoxin module
MPKIKRPKPDKDNIPEIQSFRLIVNPKNGTVVIPKLARQRLGISADKPNITINIYKDNRTEITVPKYSLKDVLYNLPPLIPPRFITDEEMKEATEDAAINRYLKGTIDL